MKKQFLIFLTILASFLFSFCSPTKKADNNGHKPDPQASVSIDDLVEIHWSLITLNDKDLYQYPGQNKQPYMMLKKADNRVEGTGGCNSLGGNYLLEGTHQISFSNLLSTKMACPDMTLETAFHSALQQAKTYRVDGEKMYLLNNESDTVAIFTAATH